MKKIKTGKRRSRKEKEAIMFSIKQRWNSLDRIICPYCNEKKIYKNKNKEMLLNGRQPFKCSNIKCNKKFTHTTGTILQSSKLETHKWIDAIKFLTDKKGEATSSAQLAKFLKINQKSAWFMAYRIQEACIQYSKIKN